MVLEAFDEFNTAENQLYWICKYLHLAHRVIVMKRFHDSCMLDSQLS